MLCRVIYTLDNMPFPLVAVLPLSLTPKNDQICDKTLYSLNFFCSKSFTVITERHEIDSIPSTQSLYHYFILSLYVIAYIYTLCLNMNNVILVVREG